ncbi:hypothetical protein LJC55_01400 [Eubacteriales bacterium OttesenSCG-928-N14]|nr:hypothetical protein [Eubacteriales bacterium OttesenSCG-928-N14]
MKNEGITYHAVAYPYHKGFAPFIEKKILSLFSSIEICAVCAPSGFATAAQNASVADNREEMCFMVETDIFPLLESFDTLFVINIENTPYENFRAKLVSIMFRAAEMGKNIITALPLSNIECKQLMQMCEELDTELIDLASTNDSITADQSILIESENKKKNHMLSASVVFVGELMEEVHGIDATLSIAEYFMKKGYNTTTFVDSIMAPLLGMHSTSELFPENLKPCQTIDYINSYLYSVENKESLDLFIIQIPGGLMKLNDAVANRYGIYSYILSQAIQADIFVVNVPYDTYNNEFITELSNLFSERFCKNIDIINYSNASINLAALSNYFSLQYYYRDLISVRKYIDETFSKSAIPVYCLLLQDDKEAMCRKIEKMLENYARVSEINIELR